jgi:hypothetical protein
MHVYARRTSYSLCCNVKDWVPLQLLEYGAHPLLNFQHDGGPFCPVRFDW